MWTRRYVEKLIVRPLRFPFAKQSDFQAGGPITVAPHFFHVGGGEKWNPEFSPYSVVSSVTSRPNQKLGKKNNIKILMILF